MHTSQLVAACGGLAVGVLLYRWVQPATFRHAIVPVTVTFLLLPTGFARGQRKRSTTSKLVALRWSKSGVQSVRQANWVESDSPRHWTRIDANEYADARKKEAHLTTNETKSP